MSGRGRSRCRATDCRQATDAKCRLEGEPAVWIGLCRDHALLHLQKYEVPLKPHVRPRSPEGEAMTAEQRGAVVREACTGLRLGGRITKADYRGAT